MNVKTTARTVLAVSVLGASSMVGAINIDEVFEGQWFQTGSSRGWELDYIKTGPERGLMFLTGFVYGDDGNPLWVVGQDEVVPGDTTLDFDLLTVTGGIFGPGPSTTTNAVFGNMTMTVNDCNNIDVSITNINSPFVAQSESSFSLEPFDTIGGTPRDASVCAYQVPFTACPSFATDGPTPRSCVLQGTLSGNMTLTNNTTWLLNGGVFVGGDNTNQGVLTIEPGTRIVGLSGNDFLSVQRGSQIIADGSPKAPIVFTGPFPAGDPQAGAGNWGGLVINGNAPINICDESVPFAMCEDIGEGGSGNFGGDNPNDSSGILRYVRVQFGGFRINDEDELNGIAFQAVGDGTVVDFVQVHANEDDGVEFFGGTVNARHIVLTGIKDDSLDWTHGWDGSLQYLLVKQDANAANDKERGIEADNFEDNNDATPRSQPRIANATFIGGPSDNKTTTGMVLRRGTGLNITNSVVTGFERCLDIDSSATFNAAGSIGSLSGTLTMENTVISCDTNFDEEAEDGFAVSDFFNNQAGNEVTNPGLNNIYPPAGASYLNGKVMDFSIFGDFFDKVEYSGAFSGQGTAWTNGWTEFLD